MNILENIKNYFSKKENDKTLTVPEGICPNCWGKQEWEGEFYKKIKAGNKNYDNFISEVAQKLEKITLKEDILVCETCKISNK